MESSKKLEVIVGLVMTSLFILLGAVILSLGKEKGYVGDTIEIYAYFKEIGGLKDDSGVYLYGKYIGSVKKIDFPKNSLDERVKVTMDIRLPFVQFIKKDAIAKISTKGILGGKIVNISPGKMETNVISGDVIVGYISSDPIHAIETAGDVLVKTDLILESIGDIVDNYKDSGLLDFLLFTLASLKNSIEAIENQKGLIGALIHDTEYKESVRKILKNSERISDNIVVLTNRLNNITKEIEGNSDSILHELVYGKSGPKIVSKVEKIVEYVEDISDEVVSGDGVIHQVVYSKNDTISLVRDSALRVNNIVKSVEDGKGSLGALLMDPTIYEDLKGIFGKIKQNEVLKSLIRFTIQQEAK